MKRMLLLLVLPILLLLAAPASAADVDGKWSGMVDTPNGPVNVGFTFKADGEKLTGSIRQSWRLTDQVLAGPDRTGIEIEDGKVDGNKIAFIVSPDVGGMSFVVSYTGSSRRKRSS